MTIDLTDLNASPPFPPLTANLQKEDQDNDWDEHSVWSLSVPHTPWASSLSLSASQQQPELLTFLCPGWNMSLAPTRQLGFQVMHERKTKFTRV